jgi:hypothetical protein
VMNRYEVCPNSNLKFSFAHLFRNFFSVACITVASTIKQLPQSTEGATLPSSSWYADASSNWSYF